MVRILIGLIDRAHDIFQEVITMTTDNSRLTLEPGKVFGWTMYPGYGEYPYRSPIIVLEVIPRRSRTFDLRFFNIFYSAGVQEMTYQLCTLRRERSFLVAEVLEIDERTERAVIVEPMTRRWVENFAPAFIPQLNRLFDPSRGPNPIAFKELMVSAI